MSPSDSGHTSLCERQNNNNNNRHFKGAWSLARPLLNKEEVGCLFTWTRCCRHNPRCRRSTGRWSPRCTGSPLPRPVRSSSWPVSCYTTANKYKRPFSCIVCCLLASYLMPSQSYGSFCSGGTAWKHQTQLPKQKTKDLKLERLLTF